MGRFYKVLLILFCHYQLIVGQSNSNVIDQFVAKNDASISYLHSTGEIRYIQLRKPQKQRSAAIPTDRRVSSFITENPQLLGLTNSRRTMSLEREESDFVGGKHLTYQQYYASIPIFGGELKFHFAPQGALFAINGLIPSELKLDTIPLITEQQAASIAKDHISKEAKNLSDGLLVRSSRLVIFKEGLLQGIPGKSHLAYEIELTSKQVREFVYIDAHTANWLEQITGSHSILDRELYEGNTDSLIWQEGDVHMDSLDQWQRNAVEGASQTYYFFKNTFGYHSYDNMDHTMVTINNDPGINCPNASWNGSTANYCTATASDDVVAHEWGHAYTEHTAGLIYAWQSGALNESYSDIWGETIDLFNNYEDEEEDLSPRNACKSSAKWQIGEDASAFGDPIRDMWSPKCKGHPGKISDPQYRCSGLDYGGVHANSGVHNHAFALLVDGGTYNGQTINGIGFTKAVHIFWHSLRYYLTPISNFAAQADALVSAAMDLSGVNLEGISTSPTPAGPSGQIINSSDLAQLEKVLLAVEMRNPPPCAFAPLLEDSQSILCAGAIAGSALFFEDFERELEGWQMDEVIGSTPTWESRSWELQSQLPGDRMGTAAFAIDPISGDCYTNLQHGVLRMTSPKIIIPSSLSSMVDLSFDHYVSTEAGWDGGNVRYQINSDTWKLIPQSAFKSNPYNTILYTLAQGNNNPMQGQESFSGADGGSVAGSWGRSVVDLTMLGLDSGDTLRLRWDFGTDGCNGTFGWYIDDIRVYTCESCMEEVTLNEIWVSEEIMFSSDAVISAADLIQGDSKIYYNSSVGTELMKGFTIEAGSELNIMMEGCEENQLAIDKLQNHPNAPNEIYNPLLGSKPDLLIHSQADK